MARNMRVESGLDRISALSDEVLCRILSFVPTKMAVRTSVLSTRWKCLSTLVSSLDFVYDYNDKRRHNRLMNSVERVLLLNTRPSVKRFRLKSGRHIDSMRMETWIRALAQYKLQELDVCHPHDDACFDALQLPACLFFCKTLVALKLDKAIKWISLKIPACALLPNLKVLGIRITNDSCSGVERLLSICPVLDDLVLECCFRAFHTDRSIFNICIATLKGLTIRQPSVRYQDVIFLGEELNQDQSPQLVINCPALENLNLGLTEKYSVVLVAAMSLVKVVISTIPENPPNISNAHDVLRGMINIQSLEIEDGMIQGLYNQNFPLPMFNKLTYLKIRHHCCLFGTRCLEYILTQCVVLETLVFFEQRGNMDYSEAQPPRIHHYLLQQSRLTALLCHLKTIEIKVSIIKDFEALMMFIEFFLVNAKILEKLTVHVDSYLNIQQREMMRELSTLPRVSKNCQVIAEGL